MNELVKQGMGILQPALDFIKNKGLREFTRISLENSPEYFWEIPAARGKTHHPAWARIEPLGTVYHTRFATYFIPELAATFGLDRWEAQLAMSAEALHDTRKRGYKEYDEHYSDFHPYLPRKALERYKKHLPNYGDYGHTEDMSWTQDRNYDTIMCAIERHMGSIYGDQWSPVGRVRPETPLEMVVHLADFMASRPQLYFKEFMEMGLIDPE